MNFTPCYQAGRGAHALVARATAWSNVNGPRTR